MAGVFAWRVKSQSRARARSQPPGHHHPDAAGRSPFKTARSFVVTSNPVEMRRPLGVCGGVRNSRMTGTVDVQKVDSQTGDAVDVVSCGKPSHEAATRCIAHAHLSLIHIS